MSLVQDPSSGIAANVKLPSTPAVATDQALVVALSPNNPVTADVSGDKSDNGGVPGATNLGVLPAVANAAAPAKTEGNQVALSTDLAGAVRVTAAALPLPTGAATAANQTTLGNQTTKVNDGTNTAAVKAASTAAVATDPALVVAISPNNTVPVSAASLPLPTGAATAANQTTLGNQTTKINDGTNTAAVMAASTVPVAADPALVVTISPNSPASPVSGTVTANQGTPNTLANRWPVTVSDGTNTMPTGDAAARGIFEKITDGTNTAAVKAASTAAVAADPALVVAISPNNTVGIAGAKSDNGGVPGATNLGVLPAVATAVAPTRTEGNQVALSTDLLGFSRSLLRQDVQASPTNSSTTPLGGGATFTGTSASTLGVAGIQVNAFSNVASAAGGLSIQQSMDGANWDIIDTFTVAAGVGFSTTVQATASFVRVVYTNGAGAQASFRLQTALCPIVEAVPRSLGQKTMAASMAVTLPSDQRVATTITSPLGALAGLYAYVSAYGTLRVTNEGPGLFNDSFDGVVIDVTNRWTTTLFTGGTLTQATGRVTSTVSTVASRGTSQVSIPTFDHQGLSFTLFGVVVQLEVAAITNNHRFWGVGTSSAFTAATPLTDAVGFEVGTDGILYACVYAAGTKTFSQALTKPTDGAFHRYAVVYRGDLVIWYQDGIEIPVASASFFNPDVFTLPIRFHNINHTTPPGSAPTFVIGAVGMSSSAPENTRISDGLYPWRKATVKPASVVAVAADPALVVDARKPATGALANVAGSASSVTLIGANTGRLGATIFNDSTAILYVKFGTTASLTSFTVRMIANAYYEVPFGYTGIITGIWSSASGSARVMELT